MSFSSGLTRLVGLGIIPRQNKLYGSRNVFRLLKVSVRENVTAAHDPAALKRMEVSAEKLKSIDHALGIHACYPALVSELKATRKISLYAPISSLLSRQQVVTLLEILGASGRPADLQRIEEILSDMQNIFGLEPDTEVHTAIIRALIKHGNVRTIHRWILNMPRRTGHLTPTPEQFHIFLEACIELASFKFMRNLVLTMRQSGCKPTNETFKILIRGRWIIAMREEKIPHVIVFSTMLDDMKREGLRHDPSVGTLLYQGYAEQGLIAYAEEIQSLYESRFQDIQTSDQQQRMSWNIKLSQIAQTRGIKAAVTLFRTFERDGCVVSPATLRSILRHSRNVSDLSLLEEEFGAKPTAAHWSMLVSNNARTGHVTEALSIYNEARKAGIVPDAALVGPLIRALCRTTLQPPLDNAIDQALSLYNDLAEAAPPSSTPSAPKTSYAEHSVGPDADIYQILLRGLASSPNLEKYFPIARSLIKDMAARNISTTDSLVASSIIVLLMRCSPTLADAFEVYRGLHTSLDEKGYAVVLNTFSKLSFGEGIQIPSLPNYFEIVKDMRRAGLTITIEVYTILLHQLGIIAIKLNELDADSLSDLRERLIATTRRTHDLLTLDASVSPDAHVWNQLMDAYQRLGCFGDSYRVWDMMYLTGRFDHISVSIILDACGYAGAWQVARKICAKLFNDGFSFDLHNWNTWLECLCRLGRLDDAVRVACLEMGKTPNTVVPDVETARILLKFSRKVNQQGEVLSRIQRYLPDLWKTLPQDLRQP